LNMMLLNMRRLGVYVLISAFVMVIGSAGCSKKSGDEIPQYEGWEKYSYKHFVFHYPKGNYWGRNMGTFSNAYERYLAEDCEFMAMEIPADTIHFFIYNSIDEGEKLTGRKLPFHTRNQIHWGRVTAFGLELARFLVDRWDIRRTDFDVLYDGLTYLRDYSGLDYHHCTAALVEMGKYIPLDSLVDNKSYARQNEIYRTQEAASLVAFLTYNYGINRFKMLWQSAASFEKSVQELFEMDLPTFEDTWLRFARQYYQGVNVRTVYPESTKNMNSEEK
jgi:hypothetical protein